MFRPWETAALPICIIRRKREILLKLAVLWEAAAQRSRDEASPQSTPPNTDERAHSEDGRAA